MSYEYVKNPHPPGHKENPRKPNKFVYVLQWSSPGGAMHLPSHDDYYRLAFSTREAAEKYAEKRRNGSTAVYVKEWPLDFVAVNDP